MATADDRGPWLFAAWPGMGQVGLIAASFVGAQLGAEQIAELSEEGIDPPLKIDVKDGVIVGPQAATSGLLRARDDAGRETFVLLGTAQIERNGWAFCERLIARAVEHGVRRVVTFAAMASPIHPRAQPKVFVAASDARVAAEVSAAVPEVALLDEGEIAGLNGVLVAVAARRGLPAACLLGQFPFFAPGAPHPKASAAILRVVQRWAGLDLDLTQLDSQARQVEDALIEVLERMQRAAGEGGEESFLPDAEIETLEAEDEPEEPQPTPLPRLAERRIEKLFEQARTDRQKALELKSELDRHGVFPRYEDRFLDLFKRGE